MRANRLVLRPVHRIAFGAVLLAPACHDITEPPNVPLGITALQLPDSAFADGASLLPVSAVVDTSVAVNARDVTFRATAGTFNGQASITVPTDSSGEARTQLKAPADSVTAIITATAATGTREAQIRFVRAYPESITVQPTAFYLQTGVTHSLDVTAVLRRSVGVPTRGATVAFSAHDSTGAARGTFSAALPSDVTGSVTVHYTSPDTTYTGRVILTATTRGASGTVLADSATLQLVHP